jgi:hypothetical protein
MSAAACVKKIACNDPVPAHAGAADRIIFQILVPAMDRGEVDQTIGEELIFERAAIDDDYVAAHAAWVKRVMAVFPATAGVRPRSNADRGEED